MLPCLGDLLCIVFSREGSSCLQSHTTTSLEENVCLPHDFIQLFSSFDSLDLDICFSPFKSFFKNCIKFSHVGTCQNFRPKTVWSAREQVLRKFTAQSPATPVGKAAPSPVPLEKALQEEVYRYGWFILRATCSREKLPSRLQHP